MYYYHFGHRTSSSPWPAWSGALHGDEIDYVFGGPLVNALGQDGSSRGYTDEEMILSRTMMTYWANFAKTG